MRQTVEQAVTNGPSYHGHGPDFYGSADAESESPTLATAAFVSLQSEHVRECRQTMCPLSAFNQIHAYFQSH